MSFASVNNTIYAARKLVYHLKGELKTVNSQTAQTTTNADESAIRAFLHQISIKCGYSQVGAEFRVLQIFTSCPILR